MNTNKNIVASFLDKYGEERKIHHTRHGLKVLRRNSTLVLSINPIIGQMVGKKIKALRLKNDLTLESLCKKAGLASSTPKSRMWEIEKGVRGEGLRFGTLFALAIALGVEAGDLLPTTEEVIAETGIKIKTESILIKEE